MPAGSFHTPVLLQETIDLLRVCPGGLYCDATVGGGGHARLILERSAPTGMLIGIDQDSEAMAHCKTALQEFGDRLILRKGNFAQAAEIIHEVGWTFVDGVVADLGVSSHQLDTSHRGFGFSVNGPLDMRMDREGEMTAGRLIAETGEQDLARIIYEYGEEKQSRRIARAIKRAHRAGTLTTTVNLRDVVWQAKGAQARRRTGVHPATRTFQAIRMAVNDEMGSLSRFLETIFDAVRPGGIVAMISFHSLEDRMVKRQFANLSGRRTTGTPFAFQPVRKPSVKLITRKPVRSSSEEIQRNPRARSARLRAAEKLP